MKDLGRAVTTPEGDDAGFKAHVPSLVLSLCELQKITQLSENQFP